MPAVTTRDRLTAGLVRSLLSLPRPVQKALAGRPIRLDGQELYTEAQLILKLLGLLPRAPLEELTVSEARANRSSAARLFGGPPVAVDRVQDLDVAGPAGPIKGRLYVPDHRSAAVPLLVYFHGGGWVICDLDTHDNVCRLLAAHAGVNVLSVDYRLAPEHRFPAAVDDAFAAFRFAVANAAELGADPEAVAVGGDSAGGNLAAVVCQLAAADGGPAPAFQLMFYPVLDVSQKRRSYELFREGFYLTESDMDWFRGQYLPDEQSARDPRASPLLAQALSGLPPAYIATAGFDVLRDEGEEYAHRLREAGVAVTLQRHSGLVHGLANALGVGKVGRSVVLQASAALRAGLATVGARAG
jgi:acetyl esterase